MELESGEASKEKIKEVCRETGRQNAAGLARLHNEADETPNL